MTYIAKPNVTHPKLPKNKLGLTAREYEGTVSTLCAGCGHDSITAALIQAVFELDLEPYKLAHVCRVKSFPFNDEVKGFIDKHERVYVVEQNRDAQLRSLLILDAEADPKKLVSMLHYNGMPMNAEFVVEKVEEEVAKGRAA